jgi:hypothetical protein
MIMDRSELEELLIPLFVVILFNIVDEYLERVGRVS